MTISDDLEAKILRFYHVEQWPIGTIARQFSIHHSTVRRVLAQAGISKSVIVPEKIHSRPFFTLGHGDFRAIPQPHRQPSVFNGL